MPDAKTTGSHTFAAIFGALLVFAGNFIIGLFNFSGQELTAQQAALKTQYEQNALQGELIQSLQAKLGVAQKEKVKLEIRLLQKYKGSDELKIYLDNMRHAVAWIKIIPNPEKPIPEMWYLNRAYEEMFGISARSYIGKTDHEFWHDKKTALQFLENDLKVYNRQQDLCIFEKYPLKPLFPVTKNNPLVEYVSCKWNTVVEGYDALAGMVVNLDILGRRND